MTLDAVRRDAGRPTSIAERCRDRGSATVEIAVALPALAIVLGAVLTLGSATTAQLRCTDGARAGAREAALGAADADIVAVAQKVAGDGAAVEIVHDGGWVHVGVTRPVVPWGGPHEAGGVLKARATSTARVEP